MQSQGRARLPVPAGTLLFKRRVEVEGPGGLRSLVPGIIQVPVFLRPVPGVLLGAAGETLGKTAGIAVNWFILTSLFQLFLYNHVGQNGIGTSIGKELLGAVASVTKGAVGDAADSPAFISSLEPGSRPGI